MKISLCRQDKTIVSDNFKRKTIVPDNFKRKTIVSDNFKRNVHHFNMKKVEHFFMLT